MPPYDHDAQQEALPLQEKSCEKNILRSFMLGFHQDQSDVGYSRQVFNIPIWINMAAQRRQSSSDSIPLGSEGINFISRNVHLAGNVKYTH
eukprot:1089697-Amorphochlora_amoeboformis.AAC.1